MSNDPRTVPAEVWIPPQSDELSGTEKLIQRSKKEPFIPLGLAAGLGVVGYGVYSYKNRSAAFTLSRYVVRLRVLAQGTVLTAILAGVGYTTVKDLLNKKSDTKDLTS